VDPAIRLILRAGLGLLLATAAVHKLRDLESFRKALSAYRLLPAALVPAASVAVPLLEAAAALLLACPGPSATGGMLAAALMALYGAAMAANLMRGRRDLDCGCAGPAARRGIGWDLVIRNAVLAGAGLAMLLPVEPRPLVWMDAVTVGAATAVLAACHAAAARMLALRPALARLRGET
jgi:hypothetical protein